MSWPRPFYTDLHSESSILTFLKGKQWLTSFCTCILYLCRQFEKVKHFMPLLLTAFRFYWQRKQDRCTENGPNNSIIAPQRVWWLHFNEYSLKNTQPAVTFVTISHVPTLCWSVTHAGKTPQTSVIWMCLIYMRPLADMVIASTLPLITHIYNSFAAN